jgi:predicted pyridoxine 5'-phosphate oxidase superfamily flavin-nucleotide-binding protein
MPSNHIQRRKHLAILPESAIQAWENHEGPAVFTTVDSNGVPNSVYVSCVKRISADRIVVADNKMNKTRANILAGCSASLLYITREKKAFQLKGSLRYETSGKIFDEMKNGWLDRKYPGHAAVVFQIEEVYTGSEKLA